MMIKVKVLLIAALIALYFVAGSVGAVEIDISESSCTPTGPTTIYLDNVSVMNSRYWISLEWNTNFNLFAVSDYGEDDLYAIGDTGPAGGIVFYVTDGGVHGMEAAPADQSSAEWGCYGTEIAGADGTAVGTGAQNTADILAGCSTAGAARIADTYTLGGYDDWFLPSKDELNELYLQKDVVGGFANVDYWSSSEYGSNYAWYQYFNYGGQGANDKGTTLRVRAVRAF